MERVKVATPIGVLTCFVRADVLVGVSFDGREGARPDSAAAHVLRRFPGEETRDAREAGGVRAAFERYFAGDLRALERIPVDPGGTPFQSKVWLALREIGAGSTWSYAALAARVGAPAAVRAVGAANGANPVPVVLPCHRVIGKNGKLVGYGGGLGRKAWLLRHEGLGGAEAGRQPGLGL